MKNKYQEYYYKNSIGSTLEIRCEGNGNFIGIYKTDYGSPGCFPAVGNIGPNIGEKDIVPFVMSLSWWPISTEVFNSSWGWISGYFGHLSRSEGDLTLFHNLLATVPYGPVSEPGEYLSVTRLKVIPVSTINQSIFMPGNVKRSQRITIFFDSMRELRLELILSSDYGYCSGRFFTGSDCADVHGFFNINEITNIKYAGFSLCGMIAQNKSFLIIGTVDRNTNCVAASITYGLFASFETPFCRNRVEKVFGRLILSSIQA